MELLAGDIGGTKTRLAIFSTTEGSMSLVVEDTFSSAEHPNFENLVHEFLTKSKTSVKYGCFGVAGPVIQGNAKITNLPWVINEKKLSKGLNLSSVWLLNDVQATAYYVPFLKRDERYLLNEGKSVPEGTKCVIAPGTGLGEAFLTWNGSHYDSHASEGGHCDFAPTSDSETELLQYLRKKLKHVSYEDICSGPGLEDIFSFFHDEKVERRGSCSLLINEISKADDPAPLITHAALSKNPDCEICVETLETFVSVLGAEAGNLALKVLATNGVYIGGGIPPRIRSALTNGKFMKSFMRKGRMSELLSRMPVNIILTPRAALLGSARYGLEKAGLPAKLVMKEKVRN
jgi:glucokinase